jgi:hypothetical protein
MTFVPDPMPRPGRTVVALLDEQHTPLVIERLEYMLVCRAPDGTEVTVFAHEVEIVEETES